MLGLQASMAASQMQGAIEGESQPSCGGWLCACYGEDEAQQSEGDLTLQVDDAPEAPSTFYLLRACVYSAEGLPCEESYVVAEFEAEQKLDPLTGPAPEGGATANPMWSWNFEQRIAFREKPQRLTLRVFGKRSIGSPAELGCARIALTPEVGFGANRRLAAKDGATRQVVPIIGAPKGWFAGKAKRATMTVVYHLVEKALFAPPLAAIAELGPAAFEQRAWTVDFNLFGIGLLRPPKSKAYAKVSLRRPLFDHVEQSTTISEFPFEHVPGSGVIHVLEEDSIDPLCMRCSEAMLMEYMLDVVIIEVGSKGRHFVGRFCENLHQLYSTCLTRGSKLCFDACLGSEQGEPIGVARMDVDVYTLHRSAAHCTSNVDLKNSLAMTLGKLLDSNGTHMQAVNAVDKEARLPLRFGLPQEALWNQWVVYSCLVHADGLILPPGAEVCNPVVTIVMGDCKGTSHVKERSANDVCWEREITMKALIIDRTARIMVHHSTGAANGEQQLLCQAVVTNVQPGCEFWLHCYGGAEGAPNPEAALKMTQGIVRPASTYRGTIVVSFSENKLDSSRWFEKLAAKRRPATLAVRFYRGCLFASLAGKAVTVFVQVAGCRMPDHRAKRDSNNPRHFNRNLLALRANVDAKGQLVFRTDGKPYVERKTPDEIPCMIPPNALHAYLYIAVDGELSRPPRIFGRVKLSRDDEACVWETMMFDSSVVDPPDAHFSSNVAGMLLCSARVRATSQDGPTKKAKRLPTSVAEMPEHLANSEAMPPESEWWCGSYVSTGLGPAGVEVEPAGACSMRRLYCHIDILCARSMPSDSNGMCRPRYELRVAGEVVSCRDVDLKKGVDVLWMHRIVVPMEVADDGQPLPPVMLRVYDDVADGILTGADREIGYIVFRDAPLLTSKDADAEGALDLNRLHAPRWCALDADVWVPFEPLLPEGVPRSWLTRSRILMAAAYAETQHVRNTEPPKDATAGPYFLEFRTDRSDVYDVDINLLGMRDLPKTLFFPELIMTSYWAQPADGPVRFRWEQGEEDPNFGPGQPERCAHFAAAAKQIMRIENDTNAEEEEDEEEEELDLPQKRKTRSTASIAPGSDLPVVRMSQLMGERVVAPPYTVPIVDYLQSKDGRSLVPGEPCVIMPNLRFELRNAMTGATYGFATTPLNRLRYFGGGPFQRDWAELCADEFREVIKSTPDAGNMLQLPEHKNHKVDGVSMMIDVFAADDGYVMLDRDVRIGRPLKDSLLFARGDEPDSFRAEDAEIDGQYFNPYDFLVGNSFRLADSFDEHVAPTFVCGDRSSSKHKMPKAPSELFEACDSSGGPFPHGESFGEFAKWATTGELQRYFAQKGWRCMTHLAAPEPEGKQRTPDFLSGVSSALEQNSHTFVRPVGHVITKASRDSRLLARLRMSRPSEYAGRGAPDETSNYLLVRSDREGKVIWVPPEIVNTFDHPGQVLMVLEASDGTGDVIVIRVPSMDLRFPMERRWVCSKTLRERSQTVHRNIDMYQAKREMIKAACEKKVNVQKRSGDDDIESATNAGQEERDKEQASKLKKTETMIACEFEVSQHRRGLPDGYREPIFVRRNGFVLRLTKVAPTSVERRSTSNWYKAVLMDAFPEVKALATGSKQETKDRALARLMNLYLPMEIIDGSGDTIRSYIKGYVSCLRRKEPPPVSATAAGSQELPLVRQGILPLEKLWMKHRIVICVSVLTMHGCEDVPAGKLRIRGRLGDQETEAACLSVANSDPTNADSVGCVRLYAALELAAQIPGPCKLRIEVLEEEALGDSVLGTALLDIEDRWYLLEIRSLRMRTQPDFLAQKRWPTTTLHLASELPEVDPLQRARGRSPCIEPTLPKENLVEGEGFEPICPPGGCLPIELFDLTRRVDGIEQSVGSLRACVDLRLADTERPMPLAVEALSSFEVRVKIPRITNIQVFKDGERNDLFISATLTIIDLYGQVYERKVNTDTHKYAVNTATFNYQFVFPVNAPAQVVQIEFGVWDEDKITGEDVVYFPKVLALDEEMRVAFQRKKQGSEEPVQLYKTVLFDDWEGRVQAPVPCRKRCCQLCCACCCSCIVPRQLPDAKRHARVEVEVEIVTAEEALRNPVEEGQYRVPDGRFSVVTAAMQPGNTAQMLIGPKRLRLCRNFCLCCGLPSVCVALLLVVAYLLSQMGLTDVILRA